MIAAALPATSVLVLEDRARVERRGAVELPAGASRVVIAGVAPVVADKTVVARGVGVEVIDARVRRTVARWRDDADDDRAQAAAVTALRAERDRADDERRGHATTAELEREAAAALDGLLGRATLELAAAAAWGDVSTDADARLSALADGARAHHRAAAIARSAAAIATATVARLDGRLAELERGAIRHTAAIELDVVAAAAGAVELEVAYTVPGACWRPYHTATWTGATLELATDACVWQATGEDWRDVALACSTARPSLGATPPVPVDDLLRVQARGALVAVMRDDTIATAGLGAARALEQVPGVDDGGQVQVLRAPAPTTIVADGQPHRVRLGAWSTSVEAAHVAFPELAPAVIVRTRAVHTGAVPLLAGPVDLVRDGGYSGRTSVLYIAPGETFELGWGADPALRVHRTHRERRDEAGVLGSWDQVRHRVAIRLSNLGAAPRTVTVTERIPVSELADKVEVTLRPVEAWQLEDDDGAIRDRTPRVLARTVGEHGMVSWTVELPGRQRRAIAHEYIVKIHGSVGGL